MHGTLGQESRQQFFFNPDFHISSSLLPNTSTVVGSSPTFVKCFFHSLRMVGFSSAPSLSQHVHSDLQGSAAKTAKAIEQFGVSIEELLMKYGKGVVDQQFLLWRVAEAAIDIYAMVATLSRYYYLSLLVNWLC